MITSLSLHLVGLGRLSWVALRLHLLGVLLLRLLLLGLFWLLLLFGRSWQGLHHDLLDLLVDLLHLFSDLDSSDDQVVGLGLQLLLFISIHDPLLDISDQVVALLTFLGGDMIELLILS